MTHDLSHDISDPEIQDSHQKINRVLFPATVVVYTTFEF